MLWRAYQGFRHFHQATILCVARLRLCPTTLPPGLLVQGSTNQRFLAACSAQALAHLSSSAYHGGDVEQSTKARLQKKTGLSQKRVNPRRALPQPLPELVDAVDVLFAMRANGKLTRQALQERGSSLKEHCTVPYKLRVAAGLMVNTSLPQRALRLLLLAHDLGYPMKLNLFETVAHQLAETNQWSLIPSVVTVCKNLCGRTSVRLLNWRTRAWLETENFMLLDEVLDGFKEEGLRPTQRTYHLILTGHVRNRNLAKARKCIAKMEREGFPMDASTRAVIAKSYRSLGKDEAIVADALEALPKLSGRDATAVLNSLLQLTLDTGDFPGALQYLTLCYGSPTEDLPSVSFGDTTTPDVGDAQASSSCSSPRAIVPDTATFTILINSLAKTGNLAVALPMLERMKLAGIPPDSVLAVAVVRMYCAAGDLSTALCVVACMCIDLPATRPIFHSLGLEDIRQVDVLPPGIPLTVDILNALLRSVLERHGLEGMRSIIRLMSASGLQPNSATVTIFLSYLQRVEKAPPRQLLSVLKYVAEIVPPTLNHIFIVFKALDEQEAARLRVRGWWALRKQLRRDTVNSTALSHRRDSSNGGLLAGMMPVRRSHCRLLRPIVKTLMWRGVKVNRSLIALRMHRDAVLKQDMKSARAYLQNMLAHGMHAHKHHLAAVMHGYALQGDMRMAERIFESRDEAGVRPDVVLYTILIAGYARQGKPGQALAAFRRMTTAGIQPDQPAIDALASAWFAAGASHLARQTLIQLWSYVGSFPPELKEADTHTIAQAFRTLHNETRATTPSQPSTKALLQSINKIAHVWSKWKTRTKKRRRSSRRRFRQDNSREPLSTSSVAFG